MRLHLKDKESCLINGTLWSKFENKIYCETLLVVPQKYLAGLVDDFHLKLGHASANRILAWWRLRFYIKNIKEFEVLVRERVKRCEPCARVKNNTINDRGSQGCLPVPFEVNQEVAIDFLHLPQDSKEGRFNRALFMMDTLSGFVQVCPMNERANEDDIVETIFEKWVCLFGAPGRITSDNDVRWANGSKWRRLLQDLGVELHLTTPYRSQANGRCERRVQEFNKAARRARLERPTWSWPQLLPPCHLCPQLPAPLLWCPLPL
jgi:transposase InsO family protein